MIAHHTIKQLNGLPENEREIQWLQDLVDRLATTGQRGLLIVRGARDWCLSRVALLDGLGQQRLLSNQTDIEGAVPFSKAENLLGQEAECVIFDQFSGLSIDVLCMAVGLVKAGGVLVLLMPPKPIANDPFGRWQGQPNLSGSFHDYIDRFYRDNEVVLRWTEGQSLAEIPLWPTAQTVCLQEGMSEDQRRVLQRMKQWRAERPKMFIVTADRGRGKSTLLGLFARELAKKTDVVVTAASRAQAGILLDVTRPQDRVEFIAPDELVRRQQRTDCLLIDEAAMLPNNLLQQCVMLADKVVLATTTGGYEGTGQGFLLKFLGRFEPQQYVHCQLATPVRWGENDLMERLFNDMLFLKVEDRPVQMKRSAIRVWAVTKKQLNEDLALLQSIYSLLVSAHYRTRPSDLRQLMEDESQDVLVAGDDKHIVGVVVLIHEGGLSEELCEEVFMGRRRPQGHLLAQMLTAQAGIRSFASYRGYRIQRITVHPEYRRQGIGQQLLDRSSQLVRDREGDYLGSSFALDSAMALFWRQAGFRLLHIGTGKGKSTGRQTVAVLRTERDAVTELMNAWEHRFNDNLPVWLLTYCNTLFWQDVDSLLCLHNAGHSLSAIDEGEINAFADGFRGFDLSRVALARLLVVSLPGVADLPAQTRRLLIEKILLDRDWQSLADSSGFAGRKQLTAELRRGIKTCYEYYQSSDGP